MTSAIVARLKTGTIKNVVPFGSKPTAVPYIVVKCESGTGVRTVRVTVHHNQGYQKDVEKYVFNNLSALLRNWTGTDSSGNSFRLKDADEYTDIIAINDDSTISMERVFYAPFRLH